MKLSSDCMCCIVRSQERKLKNLEASEEQKALYVKAVLRAIGESGPEVSAPLMVSMISRIQTEYFGAKTMEYEKEKKTFNGLMLKLEPEIQRKIRADRDPLGAAMQYARAGNYIDFGALSEVEERTLFTILDRAVEDPLEPETYARFKKDLSGAKRLAYLTDNCGEIVMDKLLVKELKRQYPDLEVTVIVRGMPVLNDAAMEDAEAVGMTEAAAVIGNGNDVAGTELTLLSAEAKETVETADLLIAKGQEILKP